MRYRIQEIKLSLEEKEELLSEKVASKLKKKYRGIKVSDIGDVEIVRRSFDGRGDGVKKVYAVDFTCHKKLDLPEPKKLKYEIPHLGELQLHDNLANRPVIVGFGPCGMFCALVLARAGLKPIVLERGDDVETRSRKVAEFWRTGKLDSESNVQFGEGGAGTFSDGKLNTGIKDNRIRFVLETFVEADGNPDILIDSRPHVGTDALVNIVKNIREEIISLGGEIRFGTKTESIIFGDEGQMSPSVVGVVVRNNTTGKEEEIHSPYVVLAIGHSSRDTIRSLFRQGIAMEPKAFSMGVRVEHPQQLIDKGLYGKDAGHPDLPPAYYKLSTKANDGRGVYSFCMCPGGEIVNAASQEGGVVTNGMSNSKRDSGFANSGILVDVRPEDYGASVSTPDDILSDCPTELRGVAYQEYYERLAFEKGGGTYAIPATTWGEYAACISGPDENLNPVVESLPGYVARDIFEAMPVFGRRIKGFDNPETIIKAIESRSSSPVRILRNPRTLEGILAENAGPIPGLYPGGEGAGYAGGITSAACDGIKIAEMIISAMSSR